MIPQDLENLFLISSFICDVFETEKLSVPFWTPPVWSQISSGQWVRLEKYPLQTFRIDHLCFSQTHLISDKWLRMQWIIIKYTVVLLWVLINKCQGHCTRVTGSSLKMQEVQGAGCSRGAQEVLEEHERLLHHESKSRDVLQFLPICGKI